MYNSFDSLQRSICPECKLPAWRRDVTTNHQLASVLDLIAEMYQVIQKPSHAEAVMGCSLSPKANSLLHHSASKEAEIAVFRTPVVTSDIIERHIAAKLSSAPASVIPTSRTLLSDKDLMTFEASGHARTTSLPKVKCEEARSMFFGGDTCPLTSVVKEEGRGDTLVDEKPRIKRRRVVDRLCVTDKTRQSRYPSGRVTAEFPYTPIVTKTRRFARLSYKDKMTRLGAVFKPASSAAGIDSKHGLSQTSVSKAEGEPPLGLPATAQHDPLATEPPFTGVRTRRSRAVNPAKDRHGAVGGAVVRSSMLVKSLKRNLKGETQLHVAAIKVCGRACIQGGRGRARSSMHPAQDFQQTTVMSTCREPYGHQSSYWCATDHHTHAYITIQYSLEQLGRLC